MLAAVLSLFFSGPFPTVFVSPLVVAGAVAAPREVSFTAYFGLPDWGACHSTAPSINAGLDIEMPRGNFFTEAKIQAALAAKEVTEAQLHESCIRIMDGWYNLPVVRTGWMGD